MKNKEFYSPIKSLIDLILTGEREMNENVKTIRVTQEFINSLSSTTCDDYNLYFLSHIEDFLSTCSQNEKFDISKVLCENDDLIAGASLIYTITTNANLLEQNNSSHTIDTVLSNFVINEEVHPVLTLSIYCYIESISKITIVNGQITKSDYKKIIEFHSIKRDLKKLFSF
jgi:hypothetical protein